MRAVRPRLTHAQSGHVCELSCPMAWRWRERTSLRCARGGFSRAIACQKWHLEAVAQRAPLWPPTTLSPPTTTAIPSPTPTATASGARPCGCALRPGHAEGLLHQLLPCAAALRRRPLHRDVGAGALPRAPFRPWDCGRWARSRCWRNTSASTRFGAAPAARHRHRPRVLPLRATRRPRRRPGRCRQAPWQRRRLSLRVPAAEWRLLRGQLGGAVVSCCIKDYVCD